MRPLRWRVFTGSFDATCHQRPTKRRLSLERVGLNERLHYVVDDASAIMTTADGRDDGGGGGLHQCRFRRVSASAAAVAAAVLAVAEAAVTRPTASSPLAANQRVFTTARPSVH